MIDRIERGQLEQLAHNWLLARASPEKEGGLGMRADSRFSAELTRLLISAYERGVRYGARISTARGPKTR